MRIKLKAWQEISRIGENFELSYLCSYSEANSANLKFRVASYLLWYFRATELFVKLSTSRKVEDPILSPYLAGWRLVTDLSKLF